MKLSEAATLLEADSEYFGGQFTGQPAVRRPPGSKGRLKGKARARKDLVHVPGYGQVTKQQKNDLIASGVIQADPT